MAGATVQCPECRKTFRIADRALLGRNGKCSGCGARFKLEEAVAEKPAAATPARKPTAKAIEQPARPEPKSEQPSLPDRAAVPVPKAPKSAVAPLPSQSATATEPLIGVNARWVPDDAPAVEEPVPFFTAATVVAERPTAPAAPAGEWIFASPEEASSTTSAPTAASLVASSRKQRQERQRRMMMQVVGGIMALVVVGIVAYVAFGPSTTASTTAATTAGSPEAGVDVVAGAYSRETLEGNLALLDEFRPTNGEPVNMRYVPNGVNLVVHLRPADLWGTDRAAAELRASLTEDFTTWLSAAIQAHCHRPPEEISEATFAFILGAFGTEPRVAVVVKLKQPAEQAALIKEFRGRLLDESTQPPITVDDQHAYVLVDSQTFAIAPADTATELQDALKAPNGYVSKNVAELLKTSDRDRLLTITAEVPDLRRHIESLFPVSVRPAMLNVLDLVGDDADAVQWSLNARPALHSQLAIKPKPGVAPTALRAAIQKRLDSMPERMMSLVKRTQPRQMGFRNLLGRFPAMLEAVKESTILHVSPREVLATTVLPAKAGPNLALGTLLAWDESQHLPASSAGGATVVAQDAIPDKIIDRLKTEVLAEFSRMPLDQVITYLGDQTGVDFTVDGDAMKLTSYTKNIPQTMSLGKVPALQVLKQIITTPMQENMAVYIDETNKKAVLSTKPILKQQGKEPLVIP
jgi:hypothetical protein